MLPQMEWRSQEMALILKQPDTWSEQVPLFVFTKFVICDLFVTLINVILFNKNLNKKNHKY